MGTYIVGDRDFEEIPSLSAKALRINLNKHIVNRIIIKKTSFIIR